MTTPVNLPPEQCPPSLLGRCSRCHAPCHRYGHGGNPLCQSCRATVEAARAPKVNPQAA
ncbi:hypothetical protein [Streptomyces cinereoruber]|uniref:hypothetical protein n=1 Tax=Streptomyces cinereoruber TaxID=67260 RepID=UPI003627DDE9